MSSIEHKGFPWWKTVTLIAWCVIGLTAVSYFLFFHNGGVIKPRAKATDGLQPFNPSDKTTSAAGNMPGNEIIASPAISPEMPKESLYPAPSEVPQTPAPTSGKTSVQDEPVTVDLAFSSGTGVYTGEVDENGLPDGYGVFFMESDDYGDTWNYTGMWEHGHLCGEGVLESMDGRLTESGNFRNDMLNGMGTMTLDGILRYEGECQDGEFWGYGKLYTESGILLFEGEFEDSQLKNASDRERILEQIIDDYLCMDDFLDLWPDDVETDDTVWALGGDIIAVSAQYEDGIVILDVPADNDEGYIYIALYYRYAVDEPRIDKEDDEALAVWGYYVGTYEIEVGDVLTTIPKIEVLYWTTG